MWSGSAVCGKSCRATSAWPIVAPRTVSKKHSITMTTPISLIAADCTVPRACCDVPFAMGRALVMLSMPLAIAGGVISLRILNLFTTQAMDLLTTIGFLILLGLVVNNAILLVMQTRTGQNNGLDRSAAVATRRADACPADLHEHADQHIRHVAAHAGTGRWLTDLSRAGDGNYWRHVRKRHIHIDTDAKHPAACAVSCACAGKCKRSGIPRESRRC